MASVARERAPLSRERIVAVALGCIDADGVDALSMRRLGQRLGVDPMAVYHHVPNKAALFDAIVEHLWSGVRLPAQRPDESWQEVLEEVFAAFRLRLLEHPRAVVLVGTRPSVTPTMLRLVNDTLGRLASAGLSGPDAMQLIDCLSGYTVGKVLAEISEPLGGVSTTVAAALSAVTPDTHPHLVATMAAGYDFAPGEEFDRGLRALIAGWACGGWGPRPGGWGRRTAADARPGR